MSLFWNFYSYFYDLGLKIWFPYRKLVRDILYRLQVSNGDYILDAGCGQGSLILEILKQSKGDFKVVGVDSSCGMLRYAKKKCKNFNNVEIRMANLNEGLQFTNEHFNKIICNNVLYSLSSPKRTIQEFYRLLQPRGIMIVSNPKPHAQSKMLLREQINSILMLKPFYLRYWYILLFIISLPFGFVVMFMNLLIRRKVKRGLFRFLNREELNNMFEEVGFNDIEFLDTYAGQNYLITAKKISKAK